MVTASCYILRALTQLDLKCFTYYLKNFCVARCRFSGRPAHGHYVRGSWNTGDMIRHGEKITYRCLQTYKMVGANMQECDNGRWTNDVPKCKGTFKR